jgi:hypothetical protein
MKLVNVLKIAVFLFSLALMIGCGPAISIPQSHSRKSASPSILRLSAESIQLRPLTLLPTVTFGTEIMIFAAGGAAPYRFTLDGCDSTIDQAVGLFIAANDVSTCLVNASDAAGHSASITITVNAPPNLDPATSITDTPQTFLINSMVSVGWMELPASSSFSVPVEGGSPPYSFAISDCDSTIDALSGVISVASDAAVCDVIVTDSAGNTLNDTFNIVAGP